MFGRLLSGIEPKYVHVGSVEGTNLKAAARPKTLPANITKKESHQAQTLASAAFVRAWVEPKKRGRPELNGKDSPFNFDVGSFAALGINGESSSFLTVKDCISNNAVINT